MGSVGASKGTARKQNGEVPRERDITNLPEYKEEYEHELNMQKDDVPVKGVMPYDNQENDFIEQYMVMYKSAYGDSIKAMEKGKQSVLNQLKDYDDATSVSNLAQKQAMEDMVKYYNQAIEKMKEIKKNSKKASLM